MSEADSQGGTDRDARRKASRLLLRVSRRGGVPLLLLALTTLALAAADLALPYVLGRTLDALIDDGSPGTWMLLAVALVVALVVFEALDDLVEGATIARCTAWLRHSLLGHVLALETRRPAASRELSSRLVANAAEAGKVAPDLVRGALGIIPAVGGTVALALIDPWLCVTFLAGMPLFLVLLRVFARDASYQASRYLDTQGTIASRLVDALTGVRTIAAAGTQEREARRILAPLPELHRHGIGMWRAERRMAAQDAALIPLLEVAVVAVGGALLAAGRITPGEILAATQYVLLATSLSSAFGFIDRLVRSRAAAQRIGEVLDEPAVRYGEARLPPGPGGGQVEFRGVTVGSGDRPALRGVDLVFPAGCLVAVAGRSGSGKSLLAALAGRLVDPDEGEVLLDDVPLRELSRDELRWAVGYGFERPVLLGATLADAIAFGDPAPSLGEVAVAARAARAHEFIQHMPKGYATPLADAPMSGGEIQRVGLARAFAVPRRLMILDDVAASLDSVTEHHISEVLTGTLGDRTRIVVAHRASTASRADFVVWLDGSRVRATAPHAELWGDSDYRALFASHETGAADPPPAVAGSGSQA